MRYRRADRSLTSRQTGANPVEPCHDQRVPPECLIGALLKYLFSAPDVTDLIHYPAESGTESESRCKSSARSLRTKSWLLCYWKSLSFMARDRHRVGHFVGCRCGTRVEGASECVPFPTEIRNPADAGDNGRRRSGAAFDGGGLTISARENKVPVQTVRRAGRCQQAATTVTDRA